MSISEICPSCGLEMPPNPGRTYDGYFHCSPGCWSIFTDVIGLEFSNAVLFAQAHQLTVDTYAVQHAGGSHPDKSVDIHLVGLYTAFERKLPKMEIAPLMQRLASTIAEWPHFEPPAERGQATILDVALADSPQIHAARVADWAAEIWQLWSPYHSDIANLVSRYA